MIILALDLAVIAIIAFCAWRGYRNGLIRGVFGVVSLVVSLFVASIAANAYSGEFTEIIDPFISGLVDSTLINIMESAPEHDLPELQNKSDGYKTIYQTLRSIGMPESPAARITEMVTKDDLEGKTAGAISDVIAEKLSSAIAFVAVFGIAFILLAIIFAVIGNLVGFVFSLPGLRLIDVTTGVMFGIAKGLLIVFALATVVRYIGLAAPETLDGTSVLKYVVNNNPIADRIGI